MRQLTYVVGGDARVLCWGTYDDFASAAAWLCCFISDRFFFFRETRLVGSFFPSFRRIFLDSL
jgi:hypothetical protein